MSYVTKYLTSILNEIALMCHGRWKAKKVLTRGSTRTVLDSEPTTGRQPEKAF